MFEEENAGRIHTLIDEETLHARIVELGEQISREYAGKEVKLICVLKGAVMFMSELAKYITIPVTMDFMVLSSYGNRFVSSGHVSIRKDLDDSIEGQNVLIVEDIIDTGRTLACLKDMLWDRKPESLKICTMLDKPSRRVVDLNADYVGFEIEDKFVLGFGLDVDQHFRNLRYIAYFE